MHKLTCTRMSKLKHVPAFLLLASASIQLTGPHL